MYNSGNYADVDYQKSYLKKSNYDFPDVKKQAFTILYIFMLVFVSLAVLLYISQVLKINQVNYKLLDLEERLESINSQNERLEVQLASKTSLAQVEKIAKSKLNMVEAKSKETLVYNNQIQSQEKYVADIPKEKFFLAQIYDRIVAEITTVQAESLD